MGAITSPRRQATPPEATITAMAESFRRALVAENKSPRTVQTYLESVARFRVFLVAERLPLGIAAIRREHIEAFVTDLLARFKPAMASVRYRALQTFFKWLGGCVGNGHRASLAHARISHAHQDLPPV